MADYSHKALQQTSALLEVAVLGSHSDFCHLSWRLLDYETQGMRIHLQGLSLLVRISFFRNCSLL